MYILLYAVYWICFASLISVWCVLLFINLTSGIIINLEIRYNSLSKIKFTIDWLIFNKKNIYHIIIQLLTYGLKIRRYSFDNFLIHYIK